VTQNELSMPPTANKPVLRPYTRITRAHLTAFAHYKLKPTKITLGVDGVEFGRHFVVINIYCPPIS